jgi:integrase
MAWVERRGKQFRVRFRHPDGTVGTDSAHETRETAEIRRKQMEVEQALETFLDPRRGHLTLAEWVALWEPSHIAGPAKWAAYRSHLRNHILPRFGDVPLARIDRLAVKAFVKHLHTHLADSSVRDIVSLLSMLLREAVADRRIPFNPCHGVRIVTGPRAERPHATTGQVHAIADGVRLTSDRTLIITAAYTGMRWGELTGLARTNTHLDDGLLRVDPELGALHEVGGKLYLGPPKTRDSARDILIPEFLIDLLQDLLHSHDEEQLFTGERGGFLRRSTFNRRMWQPAVNGNARRGRPAVLPGMHFHDLRHTHKTWLIEEDIPEVAQAKRLGHRLPGVRGIYSHVTPAMNQRIIDRLQARWTQMPGHPDTAGGDHQAAT